MHIFGFVDNEVQDLRYDKKAGHCAGKPLVAGTISVGRAEAVSMGAMAIMFLAALAMRTPIAGLPLFAAIGMALIYNRYSKRIPMMDLAIAAWGFLFFLFGVMYVTGKDFHLDPLVLMVGIAVFLHFMFNNQILGGKKDLESDRKAGVRNFATTTDEAGFMRMAAVLKAGFLLAAGSAVMMIGSVPILLLFMLSLYFQFMYSIEALEDHPRPRMLKAMAVHEVAAYSVLPLIVAHWDPLVGLGLFVLPLGWFVAFNKLEYGTRLTPKV